MRSLAVALTATLVLAVGCSSGDEGSGATTTTPVTTAAPTTTTTEAPIEAGEQMFVYVPTVGDCFDRRTLETGEDIVLLLDCGLPHEAEVFHVFDATDEDVAVVPGSTTSSSGVPPDPDDAGASSTSSTVAGTGTDGAATTTATTEAAATHSLERALEELARRRCPPQLAGYVGTPYELSALEVDWWVPTVEGWEDGQRTIGCTLHDPATERLAGSQRGTGR